MALEPYNAHVAAWCDATQKVIVDNRSLPHESLPALDQVVVEHKYHFGDLSNWPKDLCRIEPLKQPTCKTNETCYLGSLAACRNLTILTATDLPQTGIKLILTFCFPETKNETKKIRGQPPVGWKTVFEELNIDWLTFDLDDPKTRRPGVDAFGEEMSAAWLACWIERQADRS